VSEDITRYLDETRKLPLLSRAEESVLLAQVRQGNKDAEPRVIEGNLELTARLGLRLAPLWLGPIDAIQEANLVLLRTVEDAAVDHPASVLTDRLVTHFESLSPPE
jgi:DNA-directed RNA polymerase sigma subunit (sigma70/sigma32)